MMVVSWSTFMLRARCLIGSDLERLRVKGVCCATMEWKFLLLAAAGGAITGAFGWFITRNAKNPGSRGILALRILSFVIGFLLVQLITNPIANDRKMRRDLHAAALDLFGNEDAATLNTNILFPLIKSPRFEKRLAQRRVQAASDAKSKFKGSATEVAELIAAGMARLEIADLAGLFDVKRALAEKSPALCAGFWTGQISQLDLKDAMRGLTKDQQEVWITVSGRALARELAVEGGPLPAPPEAAVTSAMNDLVLSLSPKQQAAFSVAARAQGPMPRDVACQAFLALGTGMQNLPGKKRDVVLRTLAAAPTGAKN
jgi:hypothetical protein